MATFSSPSADPLVSVLYLATCAGGGGDVAFALNLAASGGLARRCRLGVLLCQQAHGDGAQALVALRQQLETLPEVANITLLGSASRVGDDVRLDAGAAAPLDAWLQLAGSRPSQLRVMQGPLALWAGADAAAEWLARASPAWAAAAAAAAASVPSAPAAAPLLRLLLTVREFGMAPFCAPPPPLRDGRSLDVSAGLGPGELGVFSLPPLAPVPLAVLLRESKSAAAAGSRFKGAAACDCYFVGYHRTDRHGAQLARIVAHGLALRAAEAAEAAAAEAGAAATAAGCPTPQLHVRATVFLPASARRRFVAHLCEHPLFAAPADGSDGSAVESPAAASVAATPSGDGGAAVYGDGSDVLELTATLSSTVAPVAVTLTTVDVFALRLPLPAFRALLAGADAAVVTGDATLNEALAYGLPCWYAPEGHKAGVDASLRALLFGGGGSGGDEGGASAESSPQPAPAAVQHWYAYVDGGGGGGGKPPSRQQLAGAWAALVGGSDTGAAAFRAAFAAWAAGVLASRGRLADRVAALLLVPEEQRAGASC
jgi:hypothetical protein